MENNFRNDDIRWQISTHLSAVSRIALGLTVNEILTFEIFDLDKAG